MKAALASLRRRKPAHLVMAIPVAPADSLAELSPLCDEIICLEQPVFFDAVGQFYADFRQTEDDEDVQLMDDARRHHQTRKVETGPA